MSFQPSGRSDDDPRGTANSHSPQRAVRVGALFTSSGSGNTSILPDEDSIVDRAKKMATGSTSTDKELEKPVEKEVNLDHIVVTVSADRLTVSVSIQKRITQSAPAGEETLGCASAIEEVLAAIKNSKIPVDDTLQKRVAGLIGLLGPDQVSEEPFQVAEGRRPVEGEDEKFVLDEAHEKVVVDWQDDAPINYYTFNSIITVEKDALIGSITPVVPPQPGEDVFGQAIPPKNRPKQIELDGTVRRDEEDSTKILANIPGRVVSSALKLSIDEVLSVSGDVDFKIGRIDAATDVHIGGTINDQFDVKSAKSISVGGAIQVAQVLAEGDVVVRGGILGRDAGYVTVGGDIVAKFGTEARLKAQGCIKIAKELMNCRTHTDRQLIAERATIIGGCHYAREGVTIATIGSDANIRTRIAVGIHPLVIKEVAKLEEGLKPKLINIEHIRSTLQPLINDLKRLTLDQKRQAAELLFKVDKLEKEVNEEKDRLKELLNETEGENDPKILVFKTIYSGVVISIGDRMMAIHKEMKGPVSLEKRKVQNVTELVLVSKVSGSVQILPSERPPVDELVEGFEDDPPAKDDDKDEEVDNSANSASS